MKRVVQLMQRQQFYSGSTYRTQESQTEMLGGAEKVVLHWSVWSSTAPSFSSAKFKASSVGNRLFGETQQDFTNLTFTNNIAVVTGDFGGRAGIELVANANFEAELWATLVTSE